MLFRYSSVESTQKTESIAPPASWDTVHVTKWLLKQARELNADKALSPDMDIFEHGFDRYGAFLQTSGRTLAQVYTV